MTGLTFLSRLTQIAPPYTRFVFLGAGIRLGLPSHPASRRRSCLRLGVSITSSSRGLSPPSDRPCRAYSRRRRCAAPRPVLAPASGLGEAPAGAHRPSCPQLTADQQGSPTTQPVLHDAVFLGDSLSRSRPPRLGRSLRSRRMRSASPNLDPTATRQESAPVEEGRRRLVGGQARRVPPAANPTTTQTG